MAEAFWQVEAGALRVPVRLTPRGGRDAVEGVRTLSDGSRVVQARVRAAPEKGEANRALEALLAAAFGVPRSSVDIVAGGTARLKTVRVAGDPQPLEAVLRSLPDL